MIFANFANTLAIFAKKLAFLAHIARLGIILKPKLIILFTLTFWFSRLATLAKKASIFWLKKLAIWLQCSHNWLFRHKRKPILLQIGSCFPGKKWVFLRSQTEDRYDLTVHVSRHT